MSSAISAAPMRDRKARKGRSCFSTRAAKAALSPAAARRDSAKSSSFCVATPLGPLDHIMTQHQCCADDQREHGGAHSIIRPAASLPCREACREGGNAERKKD